MTKTTFHDHFSSQETFVEAAVRLRDRGEVETVKPEVIARGGYDPAAMLLAMFDVLDAWFTDSAYRGSLSVAAMAPPRAWPNPRSSPGAG